MGGVLGGLRPEAGRLRAQEVFLDLAAGRERELLHHGHIARDLVPGDLSPAPFAHGPRVRPGAGPGDDEGAHLLAVFAAGDADDLHIQDARHAEEKFLDLARIDIFAAADDHVLDAAGDTQVAVFIHDAEVAGAQPALGTHGARRVLGHLVVALHDIVAPAEDLSGLAARQLVDAFRVGHAHLDAGQGAAHGLAAQGERVVDVGLGHDRRGFGESVADGDLAHVHVLHHAAHERFGTDRTGHDARAERGKVEPGEVLVLQFGDEHGGHAVEGGAAFALHCLEHMQGIEAFQHDHGRAVIDAGKHAEHAAEAVEERHGQAEPVPLREALAAPDPVAVKPHAHMGEHDPARKARGAGGILHVDGIMRVQRILARPVVGFVGHDGERQDLGHGEHAPVFFRAEKADAAQMRKAAAAKPPGARLDAQLRRDGVERPDEVVVAQAADEEKVLALRLAEHIAQFVLAVIGVHREQDGADAGRGELERYPPGHVGGPDGHFFALLDAQGHESPGKAIHQVAELAPGQAVAAIRIHQGVPVGKAGHRMVKDPAERPFPQDKVPVVIRRREQRRAHGL